MRFIFVFFLFIGISNISHAEDFKIEFSWEGLKLCNTGSPFIVSNPIFKVSGLPKGTAGIEFRLQDLYAPSFNHGGGWIKISQDGKVASNSFKYKSPCPPSGKHRYKWTAKAKDKKGRSGKTLATATAIRFYPE